ncbi:MAG: MFS transporter [Promethearchaeota archaeon]|nr:MAG: MFS transporter [Candidatus Lokiarchaeota archaeon]
MSKINENDIYIEGNSSTGIHLSYALGSFFNDFVATALSIWVFKFYETEVFLPIIFITIAIVIYGFWNMVNDPIAGHFSDRNIKSMKIKGKRFTWFIITAIPCSLIFVFIFTPPLNNDILIFLWMLAFLCIFDTLFSFLTINWQAIFPDKFRSQKERTKVAGFQILFSLLGLTVGMMIPLLIITTGPPGTNVESYFVTALITTIICTITVLIMLPGMREDRQMIDRTFRIKKREDREPYLKILKNAVKQKNFMAYLFAYLAQTTVMALLLASIPYWTQYITRITPMEELILLLVFLLASVASAPIWIKVARKYGNRIGYMCGTGGTAIFLTIAMFITDFYGIMVGMVLIGISMGAPWTLLYPCFSDVIDEIVVETEKRDEGVYYGLRTFFGRLSIVIQALTFGILHILTRFNPKATIQSPLAQWGILIGMFAVPAFFYFIGFLCMWKIYDLKPEKVQIIKNKLKELKL